jgi:Uma2 family endonuclease
MSTLAVPPASSPSPGYRAQRVRWTVDEFHELASLPVFEGRKMILVDGEILDMPPANHPHDMGIGSCQDALELIFSKNDFWIRIQMALPLGLRTDPIPDVAVVEGSRPTHRRQPSTALLIVEVSDSSIDYDAGDKADLYAAAGIADYWVLDLNGQQLLVFRDPAIDASSETGFRYAAKQALDATATISPIAAPSAAVRVADLLP